MSSTRLRASVATVAILLLVVLVRGWGTHRAADARSWRPRITILLALDTLRADRLGCYGYARPTSPFIDRIAQEGVLFENACSQANNTRMSFLSILTGRYLREAKNMQIGDTTPTLASTLSSYGFKTAAFVGGGQLDHAFGFDRGFDSYDDHNPFGSVFHSVPKAIEWLKAAPSGRCFLFVHGYDAHAPYYKPMGFESLYDPGYSGPADMLSRAGPAVTMVGDGTFYLDPLVEALKSGREPPSLEALRSAGAAGVPITEADARHLSATYDGAVSYEDVLVGVFMRAVCQLGLQDETLLVLIGDHGEEMFDDGRVGHGIELSDAELHVPLLVWAPAVFGGGLRIPDVVSLVDVMPTILDFAGVSGDELAGHSLRPLLLDGDGRGLPHYAVSFVTPHAAIYDGRHRLVVATGAEGRVADTPPSDTQPGLFDTRLDPVQRRDLSGDPALAPLVAALRERLEAERQGPHL